MILRYMNFLRKNIVSIVIVLLVIALSVGSFFIDINSIKDAIESAGVWAPIFYILIKSSTVIFAPLSGTPLYVFSVPIFGFWLGLLYSFLGDLLGSIVSFYISRLFGRPVVKYFTGKNNMVYVEKSLEIMSTIKGFLILRFATLTMPEISSYAAGLSKIKFLPFIIIQMLVDLIPVLVLTSSGLLIGHTVPIWFISTIIILGICISIGNVIFFAYTIKKEIKKGELSSLPNLSSETNHPIDNLNK